MHRVLAAGVAITVSVGIIAIDMACAEPVPGGRRVIDTSTRSRPRVTVRVYDGTRIDARARREAVTRTRRLLDAAGLASQFHDCSPGTTSSANVCETPPHAGDLIVRMILAPQNTVKTATRHVLGFATIDAATRRGTMATVFTDRVTTLATLARVPLETLLSRTMAHEIGHLLLGTNEHGAIGLMRGFWTLDELANDKKEHWSFTAAEVERFHGPA